MTGLIYVGDGAYMPPYPARDLSAEEVAEYGEENLLSTGLYKKPDEKEKGKRLSQPKEGDA